MSTPEAREVVDATTGEVRDVADPPAGALAPTSSYGCGDSTCVPCYGNEAWQMWNARRQGFCYWCEEDVPDECSGHPDECEMGPDRGEPTGAELDSYNAKHLY